MSLFMIETDAVTSAASEVSSVASQISDIASRVSGYDTSCEDGFNFDGAKSAIASGIEACSIKVQNTAAILNNVVSAHTELQNSATFDDFKSAAFESSSGQAKAANNNSSQSRGSQVYTTGSSGGYSTGSSGGSYSSPRYTTAPAAASTAAISVELAALASENERLKAELEEIKEKKDIKFNKVKYVTVEEDKISEESQEIFKHEKFTYDEDGYAKIGDYYVVTADSSVGKVGDVLRFTGDDQKTTDCIIGISTNGEKYKDSISFVISDEKAKSFKASELTEKIISNNPKIENLGNFESLTSDVTQNHLNDVNQMTSTNTNAEIGNTTNDTNISTSTTTDQSLVSNSQTEVDITSSPDSTIMTEASGVEDTTTSVVDSTEQTVTNTTSEQELIENSDVTKESE